MKKLHNFIPEKRRAGAFVYFLKLLAILIIIGVFNYNAFSQEVKITGQVTDQNGVVLPGVGVLLKGSSSSTHTDGQGKYSINVSNRQGTLVFTMVGYKTIELTIGSANNLNVQLEENVTTLGNVVVVGYGVQKKVNIIGSVATIDSKSWRYNSH